jgi:hypothetical protein
VEGEAPRSGALRAEFLRGAGQAFALKASEARRWLAKDTVVSYTVAQEEKRGGGRGRERCCQGANQRRRER